MGNIISVIDMIKLMVSNEEKHETIKQFIDSTYKNTCFDAMYGEIHSCRSCSLGEKNPHTPFAGNINSKIMFIGEAPGENEVRTGTPFVGPAGELFTKMITAASEKINPRWARESVYITNTLKCRPCEKNKNREPSITEVAACKRFLTNEIKLLQPDIVICVGATAANTLIHPDFKITQEHGKFFGDGMKYVAIYHPSYILHVGENTSEGQSLKRESWEDLIKINAYLDEINPQEN
jgi:uracil-DNA glycosylase family 4